MAELIAVLEDIKILFANTYFCFMGILITLILMLLFKDMGRK